MTQHFSPSFSHHKFYAMAKANRRSTRKKNVAGNDVSSNLSSYLEELKHIEEGVDRTREESRAIENLDITKQHASKAKSMEVSFVEGIAAVVDKNGKQKWEKMLKEVTNPNYTPGSRQPKNVPLAFVAMAGKLLPEKIMVCNHMMVDWQLRLKKKKTKENGCPWYQPNTQAVYLRTFFSHMAKNHSWNIGESELKGFEGSLNAVLKELFAQRYEEWVSNKMLIIMLF